jgi:hypothetical protein
LHKPSLKRKKWKLKEVRGGLVEPKVWPSLLGFLLSSSLACWIIDVVHMFRGEISNKFAIGDFERSPPHLFLYLPLFKRKTKVETRRNSANFEHWESKLY